MPRIVVLLLTVAALAVLALQNLATEVPLVILGRTWAEAMPLGFLLLIAVGIGALLTLIFYGLVGSRRPPESKYRPMGRRVPYPDGPTSSPLPASGPSNDASYGGSSAFVSEPKTSAKPFVEPPQDSPVRDTPTSTPSEPSASASDRSAYSQNTFSAQADFVDPPNTYFRQSGGREANDDYAPPSGNRFDDSARSASAAASSFVQQPIAGLKSVFGKKKDRKNKSDMSEQPIGDDWGQRRTKEQINSWDTGLDEPSRLEEGAQRLFNFGRSVGANAGQLAEDIASGWNNQPSGDRDGGKYADARYDELDHGWENFDDYADPPRETCDKRTYGDSLYGNDDRLDDGYTDERYTDERYADERYADEEFADDMGPEGVYDADYKVIVPPSKPLDDEDDRPDDYA